LTFWFIEWCKSKDGLLLLLADKFGGTVVIEIESKKKSPAKSAGLFVFELCK
jgi:hypothetical protein